MTHIYPEKTKPEPLFIQFAKAMLKSSTQSPPAPKKQKKYMNDGTGEYRIG